MNRGKRLETVLRSSIGQFDHVFLAAVFMDQVVRAYDDLRQVTRDAHVRQRSLEQGAADGQRHLDAECIEQEGPYPGPPPNQSGGAT